MRASKRNQVVRRRIEINNEMVASTLGELVENYALQDILMDVTNLAFRRSPVAIIGHVEVIVTQAYGLPNYVQ